MMTVYTSCAMPSPRSRQRPDPAPRPDRRRPEPLVTTSLRLRAGLRAALAALATRSQRSVSEVAQQLLEEALRTRECPGIYFADEPAGRTAKVMGTGLGVWELIRDAPTVGDPEAPLREIYPQLTPVQIRAARNYFLRHRDEIERRIAENAAWTPEQVRAQYPGLVRLAE
jgi:uncharacterized protein (DUF433 family)